MKILNFLNSAIIYIPLFQIIIVIVLITSCKKDVVATDQVTFIKSFGIGTISKGADLKQLEDDSYIIYGTCSTDLSGTDLFITKVDKYGNEVWKKNYGSKKDETAYCMHSLASGGYLLLGTVDTAASGNGNITNIFLLKTNAEGDSEIWEKTFYSNYNSIGYDIQELSTGGYVIAGTLTDIDGIYSILYFTDKQGVIIDSVYKDYEYVETKKVLCINDTLQLAGTCNSGITGVQGTSDMFVFNTLSDGRNFSSHRIGESEADKGIDIKLLADGSFIFLGNEADKNIRIVKFKMKEENYIPIWQEKSKKILGSADSTYQPACIEVISEKEYAISGTINNKEIFVLKTDSSGNQTYKHVYKSSGTKKCNKIIKTNDGNIAILATNDVYSGYSSIMLMKVNSNGN